MPRWNLGLVTALLLGGGAHAAPPPKPVAPIASAPSINAQLEAVTQKLLPLQQMELDSISLITVVSARNGKSMQLALSHADVADVNRWIQTWEPGQTTRIVNLRRQVEAFHFEYPREVTAYQRAQGIDVDIVRTLPESRKAAILETVAAVETMSAIQKEAAQGNPDALRRLTVATYQNQETMTRSENLRIDDSLAVNQRPSEYRYFMLSVHATNQAIIDIDRAAEDELNGKPVDLHAVAAAIKAQTVQSRKQASELKRVADDDAKRIAAVYPSGPPASAANTLAVIKTWREAGEVEDQIAGSIEVIAGQLDAGIRPTAIDQRQFAILGQKRIALEQQRQTLSKR